MKVILGLGNPGAEYTNTRHNAGVLFVDYLASRSQELGASPYGWRREKNKMVFKSSEFTLIKSVDTFMNESGYLTPNPSPNLGEGSFLLVHDDLDIKLGEFKIQKGIGPKLHNGVESVENVLKTRDFWRIRIGIDNRPHSAEGSVRGEEYVLQKFSLEERETLNKVFEEICNKLI
jgi:PTH1 family peptidyl-tRNA hydrolase